MLKNGRLVGAELLLLRRPILNGSLNRVQASMHLLWAGEWGGTSIYSISWV